MMQLVGSVGGLIQPDQSRQDKRSDAQVWLSERHQHTEDQQSESDERFAAMPVGPIQKFQRAAFDQQDQTASHHNHQSVCRNVRNVSQITVNPDKDLHERHRQRRTKKPCDPFVFHDFTSQHLPSEPHNRKCHHQKAEVKTSAYRDAERDRIHPANFGSDRTDHHQRIQHQQRAAQQPSQRRMHSGTPALETSAKHDQIHAAHHNDRERLV